MRKHVAAIAAATLTIGGMAVGSVSAAQAGEINNAIVNINTQGEAKVGDVLTLNAAWQVPDYSQPGDTFTLALPQELIPLTNNFPILDENGNVVAQAVAQNGAVVVTLTDFVATHPINVHGNLTFSVKISNSAVPGQPINVNWGGTSTVITPAGSGVVPGQLTEPVKYGWAREGGNAGWAIDVPGQLSNVTVTDTPSNVNLQCDTLAVYQGDQSQGYPASWQHVDSTAYTVDCAADGFTLKMDQIAANQVIHILVSSTPTAGITEATNTWALNAVGVSTSGQATTAVYSGTGNGTGETPAPVETTPAPVVTETPVPVQTPTPEASETPDSSVVPPVPTATPTPLETPAPVETTPAPVVTETPAPTATATETPDSSVVPPAPTATASETPAAIETTPAPVVAETPATTAAPSECATDTETKAPGAVAAVPSASATTATTDCETAPEAAPSEESSAPAAVATTPSAQPSIVEEAQQNNPVVDSSQEIAPAEGTATAETPSLGQRLAHTGFSGAQLAIGAVALLALGGAAIVASRRRHA